MCLPSDALLQHLPSFLGFSYLGHGVSFHGCSSKAQPLLLTLDKGYLLTAAFPDLQRGIAPLGPPTRQFKHINSSALSFLHSPTLTSIHDQLKNIALTRRIFVGKVMSLLLNMLSGLVTTFLPRSKRLLISLLQLPSAVILEPRK